MNTKAEQTDADQEQRPDQLSKTAHVVGPESSGMAWGNRVSDAKPVAAQDVMCFITLCIRNGPVSDGTWQPGKEKAKVP